MKITELLGEPTPVSPHPEKTAGRAANFALFLQKAQEQASNADRVREPGMLSSVAKVGLPPVTATSPAEMMERALSRLETFQKLLGRPDLPARDLAPLARTLEDESDRLQGLVQSLGATDGSLGRVVEEAAALAWVQAWKFHRGDFG